MLPAHSLIWGYDDPLIHLSQKYLPLNEPLPFDKFGLLSTVNLLELLQKILLIKYVCREMAPAEML